MKIAVISPKCTKESAQYLANSLKELMPDQDIIYFNPYQELKRGINLFINYGCSGSASSYQSAGKQFINKPESVAKVVNKITTLSLVKKGVKFTIDRLKAINWINKGHQVVIRETATGTRSAGIKIVNTVEALLSNQTAAFYTKYEPHHYELRINCWKDTIVSILEKQTVTDKNGESVFKFVLLKGEPHEELKEMVKDVYDKIGLDICGLDVLLTHKNKFKLLEVNSGPMLFGVTGQRYVNLLKKEIENYANL